MTEMRLTDGGLETTLTHHRVVSLRLRAVFPLLEHAVGRAVLQEYWRPYLGLAHLHDAGLDVDTVTWRASADWGRRLGYDARELRRVNADAARFARTIAMRAPLGRVNGVVGPRSGTYASSAWTHHQMTAGQAASYHLGQVCALARGGVDQIVARPLTSTAEAIGVVRAAVAVDVPVVVGFAVRADGRLPDGTPLGRAIEVVDALTDAAARGYHLTCLHPDHLDAALDDGPWIRRLTGVRLHVSTHEHGRLSTVDEADPGDPAELAERTRDLLRALPTVVSVGGCCGTGLRHVSAMAALCLHPARGTTPA